MTAVRTALVHGALTPDVGALWRRRRSNPTIELITVHATFTPAFVPA
ncbi:MAG TPA: hypothetical protein VMY78_10925 [Solirubrobacteraceae bacterium]|nr:hypothetical protein [Solirubrobacteraceae bacterium]